jgi:phosphoglycerate dehydrogenase-like enzyme
VLTHRPVRTQIAEWVIGTWLMAQHHFLNFADFMKTGHWGKPNNFNIVDSPGLRM